jgi:DNA-binding transcriptional MocR family regulator
VTQRLAADLLEALEREPDWWESRRAELRSRRDLLIDLLHDQVPSWGVKAPPGGLSLWVHVPGADTDALATAADGYGVHVMPGERCGVDGAYGEYLRLCFDRDPTVLREAVNRLAQTHAELSRRPARTPAAVGP